MWLRNQVHAHRYWLMFVLLPTLLAAAYLYLVAADQYETEAHFIVRTAQAPTAAPTGLNQALTLVSGGPSTDKDSLIVADYLTSHDAVAALQSRIDLVSIFRRPEADLFSRIWSSDPPPETLQRFYNGKVSVGLSSESGIAILRVRAFRPSDALTITQQLLGLSEERVNALNRRNYASAVRQSQLQMEESARNVQLAQRGITAFRQGSRDVNPQSTGQARTSLVTQLQGQLAAARAQQSAMASALSPDSPQMLAMRRRVAGLAQQVTAEQRQINSGPGNVATGLGTYEELQLRQQLAGKQYEAAAAALQQAREDANKQQLFITRVVDPNLPVKSTYPKRFKIIATIFIALLLSYAIGWLIAAGLKEHAA